MHKFPSLYSVQLYFFLTSLSMRFQNLLFLQDVIFQFLPCFVSKKAAAQIDSVPLLTGIIE